MCQHPQSQGTLIVFTDAKGSTKHDEDARSLADEGEARRKMAEFRKRLFNHQIVALRPEYKWKILKNIGDALVLRAEVPTNELAHEFINSCLQDLLAAWKTLEEQKIQIRIAVHYCEHSDIVHGSDFADQLRTISTLDSLDAFVRSLMLDIFGPGINRTARLSYAPSGPLFVVSGETVFALSGREKEFTDDDLYRLYNAQETLHPTLPLRGPIPLVNVKGIDTVGFSHVPISNGKQAKPWWTWEIVPPDRRGMLTFGGENKRFQVLRIVQAVFPDNKSIEHRLRGYGGANLPDTPFDDHIRKCLPLHFFVDLALKVIAIWSFYEPSDERDFYSQTPEWTDHTTRESRFLPYYILLTSSPDETTDTTLRDALSLVSEMPHDCEMVPVSYQIHRGVQFRCDAELEKSTNSDKRLYVIMFQVKLAALKHVTDPDKLFEECPKQIREESYCWEVVMHGCIRGDKDGFLLVSLQNDFNSPEKADESLKKYLMRNTANSGSGFFATISPIKVYVCNSLKQMAKFNIDWLRECMDNG